MEQRVEQSAREGDWVTNGAGRGRPGPGQVKQSKEQRFTEDSTGKVLHHRHTAKAQGVVKPREKISWLTLLIPFS